MDVACAIGAAGSSQHLSEVTRHAVHCLTGIGLRSLALTALRRSVVVIGLLAIGTACGVRGAADVPDLEAGVEPASTTSVRTGEAELIEQLSAIGYVAGAQPAGDQRGVVQHDPRLSAPGLNLMTSGHAPVALLMDMQGRILHSWRAEFEQVFPDHPQFESGRTPRRNFWRDARLLADGGLIVIWELYGIFELDSESRVVWAVAEPAHHAVQFGASGEIVHLQAERRMIPGIDGQASIEDFIVVRDRGGRELRRLALSQALGNVNWPRLRKAFWSRAETRGYPLSESSVHDPFHTNALWLLSPAEAARFGAPFRAGDALVSMAMLDTIAIVDMQNGVTRWSQQGPFGMQHEPRPTLDGNIIVFNNFHARERSSVLTLDPRTRQVVAEFTGPEVEPLYSRRSGRVQMLPNGNALVVESEGGRVLEIRADGTVVWEFRSPYLAPDTSDTVASLLSFERIDPTQSAWLIGARMD
jgi:hypothetical protein